MIKLVLLLQYNFLRFLFNKLLHGKRYDVHPLQRISPLASIKLFGKAEIHIGKNTEISVGCDFQSHAKANLSIGGGTYFNRYCMISAHESVTIGENCMFGPGVKIFDNDHKFTKEEGVSTELKCKPILIGNHCWIASDAIILKGAQIGDNSVIGAGCIISGVVPKGSIVKRKPDSEYIIMS